VGFRVYIWVLRFKVWGMKFVIWILELGLRVQGLRFGV
jgi:hypothetical protein